MHKCLLISANVTVPIGPVQLASKMEQLEPPALYRGPVQLLTVSRVKRGMYLTHGYMSTQCMSMERSTPKNYFKKSIRPSNHIPNYFMQRDKIKRKGEETDV